MKKLIKYIKKKEKRKIAHPLPIPPPFMGKRRGCYTISSCAFAGENAVAWIFFNYVAKEA
ncbi:MAG: hypothetical protein ACTTKH_05595 [Treponema sp.]